MEVRLEQHRDKKIAILGFDDEGQAAYRYFSKPGISFSIFDEKPNMAFEGLPPEVITHVGTAQDWVLDGYDLVIRSPGIAPYKISTTNSQVSSVTSEFFDKCPAPIIGVTGTKGKGTTASLIADILKNAGFKAHLLGNIGRPALDELPVIMSSDVVVYELSSFQLWNMTTSPDIAVVLMVEPEHQDVHEGIDDYLDAKANISAHQKPEDVTIFHPFNEMSKRVAMSGVGVKKKYMTIDTARINFGKLMYASQYIMDTEDFGLVGPHNRENICAAVTAVWEVTQDKSAIKKAVSSFKGLEHRLEFVKEVEGVRFYNDSFATVPAAAIAAIKSFDTPEIIILGGSDKGSQYDDLAEAISVSSNIKRVLLIGEMASKIEESLKKFDFSEYETVTGDMKDIVVQAKRLAEKGDTVILSPACASFDMFKSYKQRGKRFKEAVEQL